MSRYTLGIDTSNYATSLAVFDTAGEVVCAKKRFLPVKAGQLGLRQSDALFHHTVALPEMMQELAQEFDLTQIDAVGVSQKPRPVEGSYMPCFLAGVNAAMAFAHAKGIPLVLTTHQQGHAAAALFAAKGEQQTAVPYFRRHHGPAALRSGAPDHNAWHQHRPLCRTGCGPCGGQAWLWLPGGCRGFPSGCTVH